MNPLRSFVYRPHSKSKPEQYCIAGFKVLAPFLADTPSDSSRHRGLFAITA